MKLEDVAAGSILEALPKEVREMMAEELSHIERRTPCTCNTSPSPRRCEGQARLGKGWYCVEGKP